ncbi:MAG: RNA 2',3'-cyclic phosphodiesterase [Chloroflexaceae bacterium]|jgi:2'-5' RNA ligase|nr:RNA 2',3'-cyclic phosphodiesterase [Chloroflexaceae bacterium]
MRLFIALRLPEAVIQRLAEVQDQLRPSSSRLVKWVAPTSIHLTLQFLGEVAEERVEPLAQALRATSFDSSPVLHLGNLGAFPTMRRPQTIWMGLAGDLAGVERSYQAVLAVTAPLGFVPEARPFRPHLTLGRVRREATPPQLRDLAAALAATEPPLPIAWEIGPPLLYQSTLTPQGAVYRVVE